MYIRAHTALTLSCMLATCAPCSMLATDTNTCQERMRRCMEIADHIENGIFTKQSHLSKERPENFVQEQCAQHIFDCYRDKLVANEQPYRPIYDSAIELDEKIRQGSRAIDASGNIKSGPQTSPCHSFPSYDYTWTHLTTIGCAAGTAAACLFAKQLVPILAPIGALCTLASGSASLSDPSGGHYHPERTVSRETLQKLAGSMTAYENELPEDEQRPNSRKLPKMNR